MAKYPIDTFRCAPLPPVQKIPRGLMVAKHSRVTSFLISCSKRLWEVVGHFLGCRAPAHEALPAGRFANEWRIYRAGKGQTIHLMA
jgi:hypothetical protein